MLWAGLDRMHEAVNKAGRETSLHKGGLAESLALSAETGPQGKTGKGAIRSGSRLF